MRNILVGLIAGLLLAIAFHSGKVYAQSGAVIYMQATAGSTMKANCGTPNIAATCLAGDGYWVWQNATIGWCQPGISCPSVAGTGTVVTSLSVNGGTAQTGAVALTVPTKAVSTTTTTIQ